MWFFSHSDSIWLNKAVISVLRPSKKFGGFIFPRADIRFELSDIIPIFGVSITNR